MGRVHNSRIATIPVVWSGITPSTPPSEEALAQERVAKIWNSQHGDFNDLSLR